MVLVGPGSVGSGERLHVSSKLALGYSESILGDARTEHRNFVLNNLKVCPRPLAAAIERESGSNEMDIRL